MRVDIGSTWIYLSWDGVELATSYSIVIQSMFWFIFIFIFIFIFSTSRISFTFFFILEPNEVKQSSQSNLGQIITLLHFNLGLSLISFFFLFFPSISSKFWLISFFFFFFSRFTITIYSSRDGIQEPLGISTQITTLSGFFFLLSSKTKPPFNQ